MPVRIETDFEGGRIAPAGEPRGGSIPLSIPPDPKNPRFRQWFYFAACGGKGKKLSFRIVNAGECTWAKGFADGYRVFASDDGARYKRIPTRFDGTTLSFQHTPTRDRATFAYFPPFTMAYADDVVLEAVARGASFFKAAVTPEGLPVRLLAMGQSDARAPAVWVIAQQHPGEAMAGWFMQGMIARLCSEDEAAKALLSSAGVFLVPRMNPGGCARGNHRTNGAGVDLNRQWANPGKDAPEVAGVRRAMTERGVDIFMDVHGDETIPHVFAQGTRGVPDRTDLDEARERFFAEAMLAATPDFQTEHGYGDEAPGTAQMGIAANYVAGAHGALAMTLEMPFWRKSRKDWSPERAMALGSATVEVLASCVMKLHEQ